MIAWLGTIPSTSQSQLRSPKTVEPTDGRVMGARGSSAKTISNVIVSTPRNILANASASPEREEETAAAGEGSGGVTPKEVASVCAEGFRVSSDAFPTSVAKTGSSPGAGEGRGVTVGLQ